MSVTLDGIELSTGLLWADEFEWSPVEQGHEYTITGALVIDEAEKQAGRPITLTADRNHGWMTRATALALQGLLTAGRTMTLNWHGTLKTVTWRHDDKPLQVEALRWVEPPHEPGDIVICTLRLMEI